MALQTASASQVISKKDNKMESKGVSRTMDIRIENFDVSFGDRVLLQGADIVLAHGRRYGLVGRNGLGKTTLLRMISCKQLQIPSHITILHVEQEVVGDDTIALDSVLECDVVLNDLLKREKELNIIIGGGQHTSNNGEVDPAINQVFYNYLKFQSLFIIHFSMARNSLKFMFNCKILKLIKHQRGHPSF